MPKPPSGAYRAALVEARRVQGRITKETADEIRRMMRSLAVQLDSKLAVLEPGSRHALQVAKSRAILGDLFRDFNVRLERAIADNRALAYEEVAEVMELASRKVAAASAIGGATGGVRVPSLNLYGVYNAVGAASNWRTLITDATGRMAVEADSIVAQALANGLGGKELSRRMRAYVEGSENFRNLFERVPDPLTGQLVAKVDLRKVPKAVRGAMGQMRYNADRIAFSEIANARREGELMHALREPAIKYGVWRTSPDRGSQEEPDECDALEASDYYGLGPGAYPVDKIPPVPHPFDRCEVEWVPFAEGEVSGGVERPLPSRRGGGIGSLTRLPRGLSAKETARIERRVGAVLDEGERVPLRDLVAKVPKVPIGTPPPPIPTPVPGRKLAIDDLGEGWTVKVYGGDGKPIQKRYVSPNGKTYTSLKKIEEAIAAGTEELGTGQAKFVDVKSGKATPVGGKKKPPEGTAAKVEAAEAGGAGAVDDLRFDDPYGFGVKYETRGSAGAGKAPPKPTQIDDGGDPWSLDFDKLRAAGVEVDEIEGWAFESFGTAQGVPKPRSYWEQMGYAGSDFGTKLKSFKIYEARDPVSGQTLARGVNEGIVSRAAAQRAKSLLASWEQRYGLADDLARYEAVPDPPKFKSTKKAEEWLEEQYPGKAFDLQGVDLAIAQDVAEEWVLLAREFPGTARDIKIVGTLSRQAKWKQVGLTKTTSLGEGTFGEASTRGYLGISKHYYRSPSTLLEAKMTSVTRNMAGTHKTQKHGAEAVKASAGKRLRSWNAARKFVDDYAKFQSTNAAAKAAEAADDASRAAFAAYKDKIGSGDFAEIERLRQAWREADKARDAARALMFKDPEYVRMAAEMGRTTLRHEFGHHIDFGFASPGTYAWKSTTRRWIPAKDLPPVLETFANPRVFGERWTSQAIIRADDFADQVSVYGTKDRYEYWAEAANGSRYGDAVVKKSTFVREWEEIVETFLDPRRDVADVDAIPDWNSLDVETRKRIAATVKGIVEDTGVGTAVELDRLGVLARDGVL